MSLLAPTILLPRKGKVCLYAILEKDKLAQKAFADMALDDELNDESVDILKSYTCNIYGRKATSNASLNQHRYNVFEKGYGPKGIC